MDLGKRKLSARWIHRALVAGLIFTLLDVLYALWLVEDQNVELPLHSSFSTSEGSAGTIGVDGHSGGDVHSGSKEEIFEILRDAGLDPLQDLDQETIDELPSWEEVVALYGEEPVVYGLEQCEVFQSATDGLGLVSTAGTFNSGTNLMAELLIHNCHMQKRMDRFGHKNRGVRWQVPWGKHTPMGDEDVRQNHKTKKDGDIEADEIMPAVTIRDPMTWLGSMCRHKYTAKWDHPDPDRCPDFSRSDLRTRVKYKVTTEHHDSILHMWNDFYNGYLDVSFPRVLVRFEDLLFHPKKVTEIVCHCAGGSMRRDGRFIYQVDSAKKGVTAHGKKSERTGLVDAMIRYGSDKHRYDSFKVPSDVAYVKENADKNLMKIMHYALPEPSKISR